MYNISRDMQNLGYYFTKYYIFFINFKGCLMILLHLKNFSLPLGIMGILFIMFIELWFTFCQTLDEYWAQF